MFVGGSTLEAAEAVCDARADLGMDLLDGIASLVDMSLLQKVEPPEGEPRFTMLETIREYALERLGESGEEKETRRAHAAYCLVIAEEKASERTGDEDAKWFNDFDLEHDNFRTALDWLTQSGEAEWALRLGAALFHFWETREHLAEGYERLTDVLALPGAAPRTRLRARALFAAGVLAGELDDRSAGERVVRESLEIARELGDRRGVAVSLNALAVAASNREDLGAAQSLFEESLDCWRELKDPVAVARALSNLANLTKLQGNFDRARSLYEDCQSIFRQLGDRVGTAWSLNHQGDVAREQGEIAAARSLYEQSLAMFRELGDQWGVASVLADMGTLACDESDFVGSHCLYRESMKAFQALDHKRGLARVLELLACAAAAQSEPERALRLAGAAAALRRALGIGSTPSENARLEKSLATARQVLTNSAAAAAWMEGWAAPIETAIEQGAANGAA